MELNYTSKCHFNRRADLLTTSVQVPYIDSHKHATDLVYKEESQRLVYREERKKYH